MADQSLGTISALVRLSLKQLGVDVQIAKGLLGELGASMQQHAANITQQAGVAMAATGAAIVAGLGAAVKAGADYETTIAHVASNTNMTTAQMRDMDAAIREMAAHTSAPISQLADGFMHVANFGFQGRDAVNVLHEAMKSAVSTGGDTSKTAQLLANVLHEFGMQATDASKAMNLLHTAAAKGDMTLEQMVESGGRALGMAANLGVSLQSVTGAMSALTQHGFNAAESGTQVVNIMAHMANQSNQTHKFLAALGKGTGIDLVADFSIAGMRAKDLTGILNDLRKAAEMKHMDIADVMLKAIPALRGGIGGMALQGTALKDFKDRVREAIGALKELKDSDVTNPAWERETKTLNFQLGVLRNQMELLGKDILDTLKPMLDSVVESVKALVQGFGALPAPVKQAAVIFTALAGIVLTVAGALAIAGAAFASLSAAAVAAGTTLGAIAAAAAPVIGWIAAIGAAIALLVVAWNSDFLRIRSIVTGFINWVKPFVEVAWYSIVAYLRDLWNAMVAAARGAFFAVQVAVRGVMDSIVGTVQRGVNLAVSALSMLAPGVAGTVRALGAVIPGGLSAGMNAIANNIDDHVRALGIVRDAAQLAVNAMTNANGAFARGGTGGGPGGGPPGAIPPPGGGRGGRGGGGASDDGKAEELRRLKQEVQDEIFKATHTEWQYRQMMALRELTERVKAGVEAWKAQNAYILKNAEIMKDQAKAWREWASQVAPHASLIGQAWSGIGTVMNMAVIQGRQFAEKMQQIAPLATAASSAMAGLGAAIHGAFSEDARKRAGAGLKDLIGTTDLGGMLGGAGALVQKAKEQGAEMARVRFELNSADYQAYLTLLLDKLKATTVYTEEWKRLYAEMGRVLDASTKKAVEATQRELSGWQKVLRSMADEMTGVFTNAFEDLFKHGWGKFFQDVLQGFTQMLEKMVAEMLAKAVIFGIFNLFGGGDLLGSFGSFLGFDDWGNDRKAQHWGFDYADHFTRGMQQFGDQRTPAGGSSRSQTTVHAPIILNATINNQVDSKQVARDIAMEIQRRSPGYVT